MKRLLLPLIAALALPTAASAESYKLLVKVDEFGKISTSVLTMSSKEACEAGKKRVLQKSQWEGYKAPNFGVAAICIKSE
ncbi:hypothetical protein [Prochlorococcus sp. MIT 1223]|uniref:hypothetical protein n=1 Tax=Prochlorococcus sp. MIT 1223 TaxID=3096217 RepID=UPI002A75C10C|nr:hypothetical protein [Prochlorococcus sp. MIT 1223]